MTDKTEEVVQIDGVELTEAEKSSAPAPWEKCAATYNQWNFKKQGRVL